MNLTDVIVSDLVPLADRGMYQGMIALTWAFACGIGPPIVSAFLLSSLSELSKMSDLQIQLGWRTRSEGDLALAFL